MAVRYRDRETKRFVSEATWKHSKAQGGTRYVRERYDRQEERRRARERAEREIEEVEEAIEEGGFEIIEEEEEEEPEYTGAFDYSRTK